MNYGSLEDFLKNTLLLVMILLIIFIVFII